MASDPFLTAQALLRSVVYLTVSPNYDPFQYTISAALAVSFLCAVGALIVRVIRREFWILRIVPSASGRWIVPHQLVNWLLFSAVFSGVAQGYVLEARMNGVEGSNLMNIMLWRTGIWYAEWQAAWMMTWATALALLIPRKRIERSVDPTRTPWIVNTFFISVPIIYWCTTIPFLFCANSHYNTAFTIFRQLDTELAQASVALETKGLAGIDLSALAMLQKLQAAMMAELEPIEWSWRYYWSFSAFFILLMAIVYTISAVALFRMLSQSLSRIRSTASSRGGSGADQLRSLRTAIRVLGLVAVATLLLGTSAIVTEVIVVAGVKDIVQGDSSGSHLAERLQIVATVPSAAFGLVINFVLLIRSFGKRPTQAGSTNRPLSPIGDSKQVAHDGGIRSGSFHLTRADLGRAEIGGAMFELVSMPKRANESKAFGQWT